MRSMKYNKPSKGSRAVAALTAGLLLIPAACSESDKAPTTTPIETTVAKHAASSEETTSQKEQAKLAKDSAIRNAVSILDILQRPDSGAAQYAGGSVGNKAAVIGPDGIWPSPDDNLTPETFVRLDGNKAGANKLTFDSTKAFTDTDGKNHFANISIEFDVKSGNPILSQTEQLSLADFRNALANPETINFDNMSGTVYQPSLRADIVDHVFDIHPQDMSKPNAIESLRYASMAVDQLTQQ